MCVLPARLGPIKEIILGTSSGTSISLGMLLKIGFSMKSAIIFWKAAFLFIFAPLQKDKNR
jgi:hypothetical protein